MQHGGRDAAEQYPGNTAAAVRSDCEQGGSVAARYRQQRRNRRPFDDLRLGQWQLADLEQDRLTCLLGLRMNGGIGNDHRDEATVGRADGRRLA